MSEQDASDPPEVDGEDASVEATPDGERADESAGSPDATKTADPPDGAGAAADRAQEDDESIDGDRDGAEVPGVDENLVERVENTDSETIASEIAALRVEIDGLEAAVRDRAETIEERENTIEELESKLARARADFQNYKKRTEARRAEERERARAELVGQLLGVHDNLQRALEQDEDVDIRGGVESTLQQFDDVLDAENVTPIEPAPGEDVDPHRHEVLVRVESGQPEGTVDSVHRVGYELGDTIVREAQVTVSDGSGADGEQTEAAESEDGEPSADGSPAEDDDGTAGGATTADE